MKVRHRKRLYKQHHPLFCLRYVPNNRICEMDGGRCHDIHATKGEAHRSIHVCDGIQYYKATNYRVARLPRYIRPAANRQTLKRWASQR